MLVLALTSFLSLAGFLPGERVVLDAHNAYPYQGRWNDRIDRAMDTGFPVAIEQDLVWRDGESVVSHGEPFTGDEPALETHFFERIRPLMEQALQEGRRDRWPLITLNLDFKTNEPEHHSAIWNLLGKYESWLTTSTKGEWKPGPLLVLTGSDDSQERSFGRATTLRLFGAVHTPAERSDYRRWQNLPWRAVEPEGQPAAGAWTAADETRLHELVKEAHQAGLWIRFYTLNGHDPRDASGGWSGGYNFGSLEGVRERWRAAIRAGADFIATDQYEPFAEVLRSTQILTGRITGADYERLLEREFDVPAGTKRLSVSLLYSGKERRTVVDLGLRGPAGFRGWSGGGAQTIVVGPTFASYGYLPGPIEPGRWAVILGIPNIRDDSDDGYRLIIETATEEEARFPVLRTESGWYAGDLHSHSDHSDGRTPAHRVLDAAHQAGLDFVALSEHNTTSHWVEVERLQPHYAPMLLLHSREVTTYNGHVNAFGEDVFTDFRQPLRELLASLRAAGALTSINHPAAPDDERCMGCGWSSRDDATMTSVDAVEIVNGPHAEGAGAGWTFWAGMLNRGLRLTAIGGSDEHTADETNDREIGRPATVVYAEALSEPAILEGIRRGRVYIRTAGVHGPALAFSARSESDSWEMGDTMPAGAGEEVVLQAEVGNAEGQTLIWIRNGNEVVRTVLPSSGVVTWRVRPRSGDWYSLIVRDETGPTLFSNPIFVERPLR